MIYGCDLKLTLVLTNINIEPMGPVKKQQPIRPVATRDVGKAPPPSKAVAAGTKAKLYSSRTSTSLTKQEAHLRAKEWAMTERARKMRLSSETSPVIDLSGGEGEEEFEVVGAVNATTPYAGVLRSGGPGRRMMSIPTLLGNKTTPRVLFSTTAKGEVLTERFSYDKELPAASRAPPKPRTRLSFHTLNSKGFQTTETTAVVADIRVKESMEDEDVFYDAYEYLLPDTTHNRMTGAVQPEVRTVQAKTEDGKWKTVPYYKKGMCLSYVNVHGVQACTVIALDFDDCMDPYYTIRFPDGKEKQTDSAHLTLTSATDEVMRDLHSGHPNFVSDEPDGNLFSTFAPRGDP